MTGRTEISIITQVVRRVTTGGCSVVVVDVDESVDESGCVTSPSTGEQFDNVGQKSVFLTCFVTLHVSTVQLERTFI